MDTYKIELILERIASKLDDIYDELQWYKQGSFGKQVIDGLGKIEDGLSDIDTNLSNLDTSLSSIQSAIESLDFNN